MAENKTPIYDENGTLTDYGKSIGASPIPPNEMAQQFFSMLRGPKGEKGDKGDTGEKGEDGTNGEQGIQGEPGRDGKDGKNGKNGKDGQNGLPGLSGENGSSDTPEETRDKIESLKKGSKLSIQAIEELADILEKLKKEKVKGGIGLLKGGIHAGKGKEIRFIDDETPTGSKNDVNLDFVLSKTPIKNSVKVYRNGSRMRVVSDYTFANKTITFITAPASDEIIFCDFRY